MQNESYKVGELTNEFCAVCGKEQAYVVKAVTKAGKITTLACSECGKRGTYKAITSGSKTYQLSMKIGAPYDRSQTYKTGQILMHSTFGIGEVTEVFDSKMIDVSFMDKMRRLIHARDLTSLG